MHIDIPRPAVNMTRRFALFAPALLTATPTLLAATPAPAAPRSPRPATEAELDAVRAACARFPEGWREVR